MVLSLVLYNRGYSLKIVKSSNIKINCNYFNKFNYIIDDIQDIFIAYKGDFLFICHFI